MELTKVLVVDDVEAIRTSLCAILEQEGFEVTCAANVSEAWIHFARNGSPIIVASPTGRLSLQRVVLP